MAPTAAAAEMGALVGFLSSKVLGQYDPYAGLVSEQAARSHPGGRLMFVAPNVLWTERELNVSPEDFRLWVCLHEQTHRVQFAAAP
ncbi:zinc-dependent metalloprotease, partial [Rhizobium brockwellii]|uniref:zinc-dependent metalloprotease n=2 Tax=Bacteria TaxID=2 RepID=UPI003F9A90A6